MTTYRACADADLPALERIWLTCFEEREDAAALFFQRSRATFRAYACEEDGALVSALYLIDCTLVGEKAHYLCGAATLPQYRGHGRMSALIGYALADAAKCGDRCSVLLPASESLYGFYAKCGYLPSCAMKSAVIGVDTDRKPCGGAPDLLALQAKYADKKALVWREDHLRFAADYYGCYGARTAQSANAFVVFEPDGDFAEVIFALTGDIEELKALLKAEGIRSFRLTAAAESPLFKGTVIKPFGMIRPLCGDPVPEDVFIGITLQ